MAETSIEWTRGDDGTPGVVMPVTPGKRFPRGGRRGQNPNWRCGRSVTQEGYVLLRLPGHPAADVRGYVYEHRVVMEEEIGRRLGSGERVRHSDGDPGNNSPENLVLVAPLDRDAEITCACKCGKRMTRLDNAGRVRRYVSGHNSRSKGIRKGARPHSETGAGVPLGVREDLIEMFGGLCAYGCGRPWAEWDHVIPWSDGGSFSMLGNVAPACRPCNQSKRDTEDPWVWITKGLRSPQLNAWADVIALALSWGMLDVGEVEHE